MTRLSLTACFIGASAAAFYLAYMSYALQSGPLFWLALTGGAYCAYEAFKTWMD